MFSRLWALVLKELQAQFRDRNSRGSLIIPVILQVAIIPFAATLEVENTHLAIYNQDAGAHSVELTQRIAKSKAFPHVKILYGIDEVKDAIDNQHALTVVSFPSDFSRKIEAGSTATLQTIGDGRRSNTTQIITSYVQAITSQYSDEISTHYSTQFSPSTISVQNWFNPNLEYKWFILPSLIAMITTLGCLFVTALSVAREREQGTFDQLLVSPLTPGLIMIGKIIPALIIASIQATIILFAGILLYRIPFQGSLILFYLCILCYGLSIAGIGLLISSICATQQQAFIGLFGFVAPCIILSGFVSPIENMLEPLQWLTWFNPMRHFMVISKGIYLKGFDLALVWPDLWPLLIIGLITLTFAYLRFKQYSR